MYELFPFDDLAGEYPFMGDESVTLEQAMRLMEQLRTWTGWMSRSSR